jgi:two-component system sensor histidine kinase KdpD
LVIDQDRATCARFARDRVLVALGPDPQAEQLLREGKRIADALDADWTAV